MHPVEDLQMCMAREARQSLPVGFENLNATNRTFEIAATRTFAALRPWRMNPADEINPCILNRRQFHSDLAGALFVMDRFWFSVARHAGRSARDSDNAPRPI